MDSRVVTVRMKFYPASEVLIAAMEAVKAWRWRGDAPVPVRLEFALWRGGKTQHFAFGEVLWSQADADALAASVNAIDVITCGAPIDPAARKAAAAAAKRPKTHGDAKPAVDRASLVKPSLRFLLGADAREEAGRLLDRLEALPGGSPDLVVLADTLAEDFPLMSQADEALDGTIRAMLRQAGRLTGLVDAFDKLAWTAVAKAIKDGHPEFLTPRFVDGKKDAGLVERALMALALLRWRHDGEPPVTERLTVLYT